MAKKKAKKGHKKGGRRRVGAGKTTPVNTGALLGGVLIGSVATALLDTKVLSGINAKVRGGLEAVVGLGGAYMVKNSFFKGALAGVGAYGSIRLAAGLGLASLAGVGCTSSGGGMGSVFRNGKRVAGFADVPAIGSTNTSVRQFPTPAAVGATRRQTTAMAAMAAGGGM